ncbi:MAG TPA: hypothetical protein VHW70_11395 [Edaphobacter sp.]|nr:hypothetical protein [Edaphobacter sp.]
MSHRTSSIALLFLRLTLVLAAFALALALAFAFALALALALAFAFAFALAPLLVIPEGDLRLSLPLVTTSKGARFPPSLFFDG